MQPTTTMLRRPRRGRIGRAPGLGVGRLVAVDARLAEQALNSVYRRIRKLWPNGCDGDVSDPNPALTS